VKQLLLTIGMSVLALLTACETLEQNRKIDYRNTPTLPSLDIPPGLSDLPDQRLPATDTPGSATYSAYAGEQRTSASGRDAVLPQYSNVRLAREAQTRYLVVDATPDKLWDQVRDFVHKTGLLIAEESRTTGIIETDWAENRALVASKYRVVAKWLGSWYSSGTRDKYRLRLERGAAPGTTEIYLSHRGMEEVMQDDSAPKVFGWRPRPSEPELETEMLQRLAAHLAGTPADNPAVAPASSAPSARLAPDSRGAPVLSLQDSLDRAWRRVGLSLDRIGFTVEDRDRSKGIYYVRYIDPDKQEKKGFFSRLFGSDEAQVRNQYQVQLKPGDDGTRVEVLNKDGAPELSTTGERILSLLYEQLK
jgi:outer membrane protein assembly factor BamC